jgi:glycosyltransferase involved in cell wall biosynthesis
VRVDRADRLRVLHVSPYFYPADIYGGPIQSVLKLCESTARLGHDVRVVTTNANGPTATLDVVGGQEHALCHGVRVRYFRRLGRHSAAPAMLTPLAGAIASADVVHLNAVYSFTTFPTLAYCRLLHKPLVWSPRGSFQRWAGSTRVGPKAIWEQICRVLRPSALRVHATSNEEAAATEARLPWLHASVIPNGVEIPEHAPTRTFLEDGRLKLVYLGRLHPIKALDRLLKACKRLNDASTLRWHLVLAGAGEPDYVSELKRLVDAYELGPCVEFAGHVAGRQKEAILGAADVLVLPSHVENFGLVVAEALARGLPVIASRGTPWGGLEEVGAGLWVDNDPSVLAGAILQIRTRSLASMGAAGRNWVEQEFSWPAVGRRTVDLYRALLSVVSVG